MGKEKAGFLTPKAIANRIKAKGLQKLRWYCQMCQKQCRDENGFKCHLTSESHQRQLLLFAENPDTYIDSFSSEFEETFLEVLKRRFGTKRVNANIVYQEYISDRDHLHMNATQWETLTDFVKWLGREGKCVVDQTEKGWFMQYIDRNPEMLQKQMEKEKKERMDMDDEERAAKFIQQQIERANATQKPVSTVEATELHRESEEEKVVFSLGGKKPVDAVQKQEGGTVNALEKITKKETSGSGSGSESDSSREKADKKRERRSKWDTPATSTSDKPPSLAGQKRKSALDEIMEMEESKKEKMNRRNFWLHPGIVVKVITKKLGDKYYKKKAVVKEVVDQYASVVKMLDSGDKVKLDQAHLETIIPAIGKKVLIVNGAYRGSQCTLTAINEKKFSCSLKIDGGPLQGRQVDGVAYEDFSKLHIPL